MTRIFTITWYKRYTVIVMCFLAMVIAYSDRVNISVAAIQMQQELGWNDVTKGLVLSSFFIGYLCFQIIGGWLANRYGGKIVLGFSVLIWSVFTIITPFAANLSMAFLLGARVLLGMGEASTAPSVVYMYSRWIPANERGRAMAIFSSGAVVGTLLTLMITGYVIVNFGWPMAFYSFGMLGFIWAIAWFGLISKSPEDHHDISAEELVLLANNSNDVRHANNVPWKYIFSHPAAWALIAANFSTNWGLYVALAWLPSYFNDTHGISIAGSGIYSSAPWLSMFIAIIISGWLADKALGNGISATTIRKTAQTIGLIGSAIFLVMAGSAANTFTAILTTCGALSCLGLCYAGFAPAVLEMSPRYGEVIFSISNTFGTVPGVIGVAVTGWLVELTGTYVAAFALTACVHIIGALAWLIFGTARKVID